MKEQKVILTILAILAILFTSKAAYGVHREAIAPIIYSDTIAQQKSVVSTIGTSRLTKRGSKRKQGKLRKWFGKRLTKFVTKRLEKKLAKKDYRSGSTVGLILGITSLAGLFLAIAVALGTSSGFLFLVVGLIALIADIICLVILHKTRDDKEAYKKQRKRAKLGLIFALLTGLLPLALFALVLALYS